MDVGVGGLDGPVQRVLVVLVNLLVTQVPPDVGPWQGLYLALEVQPVALLPRGWLPVSRWLNNMSALFFKLCAGAGNLRFAVNFAAIFFFKIWPESTLLIWPLAAWKQAILALK